MQRSAIFLDRDGVINENPPNYVKNWGEFHFNPGILQALKVLSTMPWALVVISNQSAVGRGLLSLDELENIHKKMRSSIQARGGRIDAIFTCTHLPRENCDCRKPKPGLIFEAAQELELDLSNSIFIGDSPSDVSASLAAGVLPVLLMTPALLSQDIKNRLSEEVMRVNHIGELASILSEPRHFGLSPREIIVFAKNPDLGKSKF